ncbi:hypothetical protein ARTHRO9AX_10337 [Arthrobacter sp. 9AX]|nr:hypothetical protein ARTHRO9AX_10337 [Arthrobacter sp. 9AX]
MPQWMATATGQPSFSARIYRASSTEPWPHFPQHRIAAGAGPASSTVTLHAFVAGIEHLLGRREEHWPGPSYIMYYLRKRFLRLG